MENVSNHQLKWYTASCQNLLIIFIKDKIIRMSTMDEVLVSGITY